MRKTAPTYRAYTMAAVFTAFNLTALVTAFMLSANQEQPSWYERTVSWWN